MYKVVKGTDGTVRKIDDHMHAFDFMFLTRLEAADYFGKHIAPTDIVYYVLNGVLEITFDKTTLQCVSGDSCFISKGETYILSGTFQVLSICSPT
ncbi:hypothetical protein A3D80_02680 [Candidatus Roizmanbacteria bacterium RIFCSPHIGHO2_02_FULL_40_13b]|uniref:Cupin 2 conserved barrel domain-containing protein n=1 Tax=Candidatus Roizmanbacteria bacterium RIFCSPHIGHO2_01_FULL_39_24 TaxID=1802032 RepID=A0A1F7GI18_9BACT|nr:MAG: hypothetical protein A2799_03105 [Candidatus Roizmanbacteria bacterium RIFCSPHIGHO2_01_FULL_39_24]OGK27183.1 MAG: hypothetical protein A3D80_02680 [Candidatus Roizmanbacteria bacterium RIFCSPHIGHO2_02_FULL_40_13b]OGK49510.1 MAG: hypothetical protein A3A56_02685 [Candidatus Roizmanbacteria bacterium RIFCSPLOWO2_01_FULL_40_32]OGK57541.1 MAG: hypothetical protein A3H83_03235 [Candidatus Roizmanbacteria bacterium RIFCSPLOWO2_02_FULL_39_8]